VEEIQQRQRSSGEQLSYSGASELKSCAYKYYLRKIKKAEVDADQDADTYALRFGSAVHAVMEKTFYKRKLFHASFLKEAVEEHKLSAEDIYKAYACVMALYEESEASELDVIACEKAISSEFCFGYIDAIGVDVHGRWWIMDLKTSGWVESLLPIRLARDPQLNLYAAHKEQVAEMLGIDVKMFGGCIYRVVSKTKSDPHPNESMDAFVKRTKVKAFSVIIPEKDLNPELVVTQHLALAHEATLLKEADENGIARNFGNCIQWNRPCEFYSHCYGKTYSEALKEMNVSDTNHRINVGDVLPPCASTEVVEPQGEDMLNITCTGTQVFNENRICVTIKAVLGMAEQTKPYYFDCSQVPNAESINKVIAEAITKAKGDLYAHLASLAESMIYQNWATKLGVTAVPAVANIKEEIVKPVVATPVVPAPVVEEAVIIPEVVEAPAAAKVKVVKAKAVGGGDCQIYVKGNPDYVAILKSEVNKNWPKNWAASPEYKAKLGAMATALAEQKVAILIDGKVAPAFEAFVAGFGVETSEDIDL
jgi:hypothetical protein